jgi:NAD-dependent dihydropyrimidine dehydrogenase PreA subunit
LEESAWHTRSLNLAAETQLYINPDECIDCGACVPACPVQAIFPNEDVPEKWAAYIEMNANWYKK